MKNFKILFVFILAFSTFSFVACDDEPLEGEFASGTGGGNGNGNGGNGVSNCTQATTNVTNATAAFNQVSVSDSNYTMVCNDYANALEDFLTLCGDSTGAVQAIIDSLDCTGNSDCVDAQSASQLAENEYNADTSNVDLCNAYINALQNEISNCGDSDGSLQDIIDNLGC